MNFSKFDNNAKSLLNDYLKDTGYVGSDYSYYAFLRWFDNLEYAQGDRALFLRAYYNGSLRYWAPLVKDGMTQKQAVAQLPIGSSFAFCTQDFASEMQDAFVDCTNRDWSEYIYRASDFIALVGKRYNAKRNHVSKFKKLYDYDMRPYEKTDEDDVMQFEKRWLESREFASDAARESAQKESKLMFDAINASLSKETICDVLTVDGKLVGFSVGEIMPSGNAVVMFEKADIAYEGVYSFLAHEFAARNFSGCEYINRQEDMGLEGLRKSKLSYYPEFLLDKYILTPKTSCERDADGELIKPCVGDSALLSSDIKNTVQSGSDTAQSKGSDIAQSKSAEISNLRENIKNTPLDEYKFRQLTRNDFNAAMTFFKCGISHLKDKKFFMNYTDEELLGVLDNGYMLGAFYEGHLVATCAVDTDKIFGDKLKKICRENALCNQKNADSTECENTAVSTSRCLKNEVNSVDRDSENKVNSERIGVGEDGQYYEFSGIMVCPYHQRKGLAKAVCNKVIDWAKSNLNDAVLCAVVQFDNLPSLANLGSLGFVKTARARYEEYDFVYLTRRIN